ncbi:MAG: hypothetical protein AAFU85_18860 [Planctomycetota bacterium]
MGFGEDGNLGEHSSEPGPTNEASDSAHDRKGELTFTQPSQRGRPDRGSDDNGSIARLLYTQNPFYLISCLLVIYGCQSLAIYSGDVLTKAFSMTGGIAAYTLLMSLVCVAVVRVANVWQDARSIYLVVLISLAAMTTGFDELCITNRDAAMGFSCAATLVIVLALEGVRRLSGLRLGFWYTAALYAHFAALVVVPNWLGYAVASRNDALANWGAMLFSVSIAVALLLLVPAVRRGIESTKNNGTPWNWPLFPLAAFVVLMVLAAIRAHAVWMSFGFYGVAGRFEPFLLLPLVAAILLLVAECGLGTGNTTLQRIALFSAPALLMCGLSNHGDTWLPIRADLQMYFGSSWTTSLLVTIGLYGWYSFRGIRYASAGIPIALLALSSTGELPRIAEANGIQSWMIAAAVSVGMFGIAIRHRDSDWAWLSFCGSVFITLLVIGESNDPQSIWRIVAASFAGVAMLFLGAVFETELARWLRHFACVAIVSGLLFAMIRMFFHSESWPLLSIPAVAAVTFGYAFIVHRRGWLLVSVFHAAVLLILFAWSSRNAGSWKVLNWPIASGLACLGVGLAITTSKSGLYQRMREREKRSGEPRFRPGL